jgi:hypothetical protein
MRPGIGGGLKLHSGTKLQCLTETVSKKSARLAVTNRKLRDVTTVLVFGKWLVRATSCLKEDRRKCGAISL